MNKNDRESLHRIFIPLRTSIQNLDVKLEVRRDDAPLPSFNTESKLIVNFESELKSEKRRPASFMSNFLHDASSRHRGAHFY